ncbi:4Fe-4S double cluster binding domain-containing protein [Desulfobotulus mexicanus]|nr:4Fe-4S double cluster binding domain-containing protein [Desulfobotulus mexicanus]
MDIGKDIIERAMENGASLAGIARMEDIKKSASHTIYNKMGDYSGAGIIDENDSPDNKLFSWPDSVKSVLVIGLSHPQDKPELDWWDGRGTSGNRILIDIIKRTSQEIENTLKIKTTKLHYFIEKGGIFLKDAAVLAGLGCIGKNNMLVTPSHGPRIRLRALGLDAELSPTGPVAFDPCADCKVYCRKICPENAISEKSAIFSTFEFSDSLPGRDGTYNRDLCSIRMEKDLNESSEGKDDKEPLVKYCRLCEYVCPAGKPRVSE